MLGDDQPVDVQLRGRRRARSTASLAELGDDARSSSADRDGAVDRRASRSRTAPRSARFVLGLPRSRRGARAARAARRHRRVARTRSRPAREPASGRRQTEIQRILALVPWIVAHPGVTKAEIAQRFGMTVDAARATISSCVLMIGVPPYSPGDYLDVERRRRAVTIRLAEYFGGRCASRRPKVSRCSPPGRALLAVPGLRPGRPARDRARRSSRTRSTCPALVVDVGEPTLLEAVRDAADAQRAGRDRLLVGRPRRADDTRVSIPRSCSSRSGDWYVGAYCHRADGERMFRVDRIRAVRATGERFEPGARPAIETARRCTDPAPDDPRVTLRLRRRPRGSSRPIRRVGHRRARTDGSTVVLAVSEPAWLERLLVRLGPGRGGARAAGMAPRGRRSGSTGARPLYLRPQTRRHPADLT